MSYYPFPLHATGGGPGFHWYSATPWFAYQFGRESAPSSPSARGDGALFGGWTGTFGITALVGLGVVGYLIYRNVIVSEHTVRGFGSAFSGEEEE